MDTSRLEDKEASYVYDFVTKWRFDGIVLIFPSLSSRRRFGILKKMLQCMLANKWICFFFKKKKINHGFQLVVYVLV